VQKQKLNNVPVPSRRETLLRHLISLSCLTGILALCCFPLPVRASTASTPSQLTEIARNLCGRLHLGENIEVRIDENNEYLVSSEPLSGAAAGFRISFDKSFLETLTDDEVAGAIAHELGHVWIFTHHPYLQTESLANEIALRVVTRDTMMHVYSRLWSRTGVAGNIDELLGPAAKTEAVKNSVSLH
jgi:hypothetical protein